MNPDCPSGYTQYERRYYAGNWWFRTAPNQAWQLCRGGSR